MLIYVGFARAAAVLGLKFDLEGAADFARLFAGPKFLPGRLTGGFLCFALAFAFLPGLASSVLTGL